MPSNGNLTRDVTHVIEQGIHAVRGLAPEVYSGSGEPIGTSGIGAHIRHCLDFFDRLVEGLASGELDYDKRERDARVEVDRDYAVERMERTVQRLRGFASLDPSARLQVRADADPDEAPLESTVGREFKFALSHTIHHYAIIAMYLRQAGEVVDPDFGVAPSTLRFWEESGRCAPSAG